MMKGGDDGWWYSNVESLSAASGMDYYMEWRTVMIVFESRFDLYYECYYDDANDTTYTGFYQWFVPNWIWYYSGCNTQ